MGSGLNPADSIMVSLKENSVNEYIVFEGNKRVTLLKLLCTLSLISNNHSNLRKKLTKLRSENHGNIITIIEYCIFDDPNDADG